MYLRTRLSPLSACRYHWKVTGELLTRSTCCSPSAFALASDGSSDGRQMVVVGGSSPAVDMFCDLSHKAVSFAVPETPISAQA